jgi:hypothetical protein
LFSPWICSKNLQNSGEAIVRAIAAKRGSIFGVGQAVALSAGRGLCLAAAAAALSIATPSFAASPDFSHLDDAAARAASCDRKANAAYETGDNKSILMALNEQGKCLEVVMFSVAREFYDDNAFGAGGVEARIHEMRENLAQLYSTIYSEPRTCAPNCGEVYQIWAAEAYVTSIRIMLDDMIDRLKDESPLHQQ